MISEKLWTYKKLEQTQSKIQKIILESVKMKKFSEIFFPKFYH